MITPLRGRESARCSRATASTCAARPRRPMRPSTARSRSDRRSACSKSTCRAAAGDISERLPETAIVMLTVSRDDADLFDALRAGAAGYLLKDIDRRQLPADLRGVLAGEAPLPRALVTKLIEEFRERGRRRKVLLAERPGVQLRQREWEILELLAEGLSTAEIASRLFIAEVTVRTHVSSILKKLRVPTREAAVELLRGR